MYNRTREKKYREMSHLLQRFENGIKKLKDANTQVIDLKEHLKKEEPKLKKTEMEVNTLVKKLEID